MNRHCSHCGLVYEREQGYFIGAIYISVIIVESTLLIAAVVYFLRVGSVTSTIIGVLLAMAVVMPFLLFHHSRSLWLSIDHYIDPPKQLQTGPSDENFLP
jgi:hypothetical protein